MIDDLLRPIGPGPRPPADGFVQALRAGRRKRWKTLRTNLACGTAAIAAVVTAMVPRLAITSFAGLEPTNPVIGTHNPPGQSEPIALTPSPTPQPEPSDPVVVDDRPGHDTNGPAGYAPPGYAQAASRGPAGPRAEGSPEPMPRIEPDGTDDASPTPYEPTPTAPPQSPPHPSPDPPSAPDPEPIDQSIEEQPATDACQSNTWCWSAEVVGTYTFRLLACRGATSGELQFDKENEADFRVLRDGAEVWRWSTGQPDPTWSHPLYVDRWACAVWSTQWHAVDQNGDAVPAGAYWVEATSRSSSVPSQWWGASFSVT